MTSKPNRGSTARERLIALLTTPPERHEDSTTAAHQRAWNRADEQARRGMLKDCGWL